MITGHVVSLQALLPVTFRLTNRSDLAIEFVVDTGFTGDRALPPAAVEALQLTFIESVPANLATDEEVELPVYAATILWNGIEQEVRVLATGRRPLLGTALMEDRELFVQFQDGGLVTLDDL